MSHVSIRINSVNATWIAALPQWCLASIGLTNSVHPYCKLATHAIATTPTISCTHVFATTDLLLAAVAIGFSSSVKLAVIRQGCPFGCPKITGTVDAFFIILA